MKDSLFYVLMAAGIAAAGMSSPALCASEDEAKPKQAPQDRGAFFDRLDQDGDGKITETEAPAAVWEKLSRLDKDGDGAVAKSELAQRATEAGAAAGGKILEFLKSVDADGDGKITEAEAGERWARLQRLDKNGDGAVSLKDELGRPEGGTPGSSPGEFFARMDKNGDDKLTEDEAPGQAWERLAKLDQDGDGAISKSELAAARAARDGNGSTPSRKNAGGAEGTKPKRPPTEES